MFRTKSLTYEIMIRANGRWQLESVKNTEKAAISHAEDILDQGPYDGVRVVQEEPGRKEKIIYEQDCTVVSGPPISISAVDFAPICQTTADMYGYEARLCAGRLLRKYLDREGLTPLELLYRPGMLKRLAREDRLMNQAVQKVAGLQAREFNVDKSKRIDFLYEAVSELSDPNFKTRPIQQAEEALKTGGLKAAIGVSDSSTEPAHTLHGAIAAALSRSLEWQGKLEILLNLSTGQGDEAILDQAISEILDGGQAVKEILGRGENLNDFIQIMVAIIQGKTDAPDLAKLSSLIAAGRYENTLAVLNRKVASTLGHIQPLTKESDNADRKALEEIISASMMSAGFIGGSAFSEAVTKRARMTFATGDDLTAKQSIDEVIKRVPNKGVALGYLFELARSAFAEKHLADVGAALTKTLASVSSLKDLVRPSTSPEYMAAAAKDLGARLEKGGFPEAIGSMIAKDISKLLSGEPVTAKAIKADAKAPIKNQKKEYKRLLNRLRITANEIVFKQGEQGDEAYLVDSGSIEIIKDTKEGEKRVGIVERGEIFGEMALIDLNGRSGTARALEDSVLKIIPAETFMSRLEKLTENDIVLRRLIDVYVKRLRNSSGD